MIRLLVADDHEVVREGLRRILDPVDDLEVVAEAADGEEALEKIRKGDVDVALLDISMPGMSGLEVLEKVNSEVPGVAVVILSMHDEKRYAARAFRLGAMGYLTKARTSEELLTALRRVSQGQRYIAESLAEQLADLLGGEEPALEHQALSEREYQVMIRLARGRRTGEIARELELSPKTVSTYRTRVLRKMGLENNAALTSYAIACGLMD